MYLAKVVAQGCSEIADGREFIVECEDHDGGKPYYYEAPTPLEWTEPNIKILGTITWNTKLICPDCNEICANRMLLFHTASWMFTAFYCKNHPKNLFFDIFPKLSTYDTGCDYTNAFAADIDPTSNPDLPKGVTIINRQGPGEYYERCKKRLENTTTYILTPQEIKALPTIKVETKEIKTFFTKLQQKIKAKFTAP